ncbi:MULTISPECIES: hypothetical protein [unclassified Corallococcus]|uniref:hypothetical protein n=1 Tax=unclassified Corallococcus TaxID=2685029 RepID=UPI001A900111|nr:MULTISPECIES: hypothetical protein [unclassified Corallococcus]MBN9683471.1 hypothetical protein [Corallococcus sp. NCSPR001]WAS85012.1 hypothetical protein O0N60_37865 [Corallococcus sp. NCRR]
MRVAIIAGLMAVGLLAGCGGAEEMEPMSPEETQRVVEMAVPSACTDACDQKYYQCYFGGGDPYYCNSYRAYCISQCP